MSEWRKDRNIRNKDIYQVIDKLLFESPELMDNQWFKHRIETIGTIEDEGEKAPPLSVIIDYSDEGKETDKIGVTKEEKTLVEMLIEADRKQHTAKEKEEDERNGKQ